MQSLLHALVPLPHFLFAVGVGQGEHGAAVCHLCELVVEVTPHPLRRTVGVEAFGMRLLQVLQFAHELVELQVADTRLVKHVVPVIVFVQLLAQDLNPRFDSFFVHYSLYFSEAPIPSSSPYSR